jgi:hypothetical protein
VGDNRHGSIARQGKELAQRRLLIRANGFLGGIHGHHPLWLQFGLGGSK